MMKQLTLLGAAVLAAAPVYAADNAAPAASGASEPAAVPSDQPLHLDPDTTAEIASKQNPAVIYANTDVAATALQLKADRIYWRPTLTFQDTTQYGKGEPNSFFALERKNEPGIPNIHAEGGTSVNSLNLSMPLYSEGALYGQDTWNAVQDDGKHGQSVSNSQLQIATSTYQAVAAYFNAASARDQLVIQQDTLKKRLDELKIVDQRVIARVSPVTDRMLIESDVASAQAGVNTAQSLYDVSLVQVHTLLALPLTRPLDIAAVPPPPATPSDLAGLIKQAINDHPAVKSQEAAIKVAQGQMLQAKADALPTVTLTSSYSEGSAFGSGETPTLFYAGVNVSVPITTFGQTSTKIKSKALDVTESQQKLEYERSAVAQGIATAYQSLVAANSQLPALKAKVDQYQYTEDQDRSEYMLGHVTLDKLLDDESNTLAAKLTLVGEKFTAWVSYAALIDAMGRPYSSKPLLVSQ